MTESFYDTFGTRQSVKPDPLVEQIEALQYNLNIDYNAKLDVDGVVGRPL